MSTNTEISASDTTTQALLSRKCTFVVPEYQRQYSWEEEQWDDFWNDLISTEEESTHFLGSIVLVEQDTLINELDKWEVVDGQQRLTTMSLLLCMLREHYKNVGRTKLSEKIKESYLYENDPDLNDYQKLKLNSLDNDQYRRLLNGDIPREEASQLRKAAIFFADKISELDADRADIVRKKLLNNFTIVTIECDNEASAFRLFETLNDRGLELSAVDLMKNHIYQKARNDDSVNTDAIKQDWESIIEDLRYELDKPYRFFIHYILFANEPDIVGTISKNTLYHRFQQLVNEEIPESDVSLNDYISKMANTAILYLDIVNAEVREYGSSGNKRVNSLLERLNELGYTQERTYLLGVLSHLDSATEAVRAIKLIESFLVRQRFTSGITGSQINELYSELCSDAFHRSNSITYIHGRLSGSAPSDEEFVAAISSNQFKRSKRTRLFLERIESEFYRSGESVNISGEIEHIAPRKAYTATKYNTWPDYFGVGEDTFNEEKDRLGNLTLLEKRLNLRASDNPFVEKKDKYRESEFKMAQAVAEKPDWSIDMIQNRTNELARRAAEIWDFSV